MPPAAAPTPTAGAPTTGGALTAAAVAARLLAWYGEHGRDLPWRGVRDPYAVLVAEVMLQQTQAARVAERWPAWLARWPTVEALAHASPADVIAAWSGLGYNRRAVALHRAARDVAEHGWPRDVEGLRRLPGVGPYTAAAVACQAFGADVIPVDVNVRRVLERSLGRVDVEPPPGRAAELVQALFDVGATVCVARVPRCAVCPLADGCPARGSRFAPTRRQAPFEGSRRQARGRLLDRLRAGPVPAVECDPGVAAALVRDGLARHDGALLRLPTGP